MFLSRDNPIPSVPDTPSCTGASCTTYLGNVPQPAYLASYESIEWENNGHRRDNNCRHYQCDMTVPSGTYTVQRLPAHTYTHVSTYAYWAYFTDVDQWTTTFGGTPWYATVGTWTNISLGSGGVLEDYDFETKCQDGLKAMLPGIKSELSLLNSIYELKDFKTLPTQLSRVFTTLKSLASWIASPQAGKTLKQLAKMRTAYLREGSKTVADAYLLNEFALSPLLNEITILQKILKSLAKQLKKLLENEGKVRRSYYVRELDDLIITNEESIWRNTSNSSCYDGDRFTRIVSLPAGLPTFRCYMEYKYHLSAYQRAYSGIMSLLDVFGINLNPQIIWNAIPWSFAIDWVFRVNGWLGQFANGNMRPTTHIRRFGYSVELTRNVECKLTLSVGSPLENTKTSHSCLETLYYRRRHEPDWYRGLETSGLNSKEFSFIGALAASRL